ncbi:PGF-pre-PGF domain-containing protein [Methanolobus sp. WCC4]|uniref:PGF-pre-PGF domain-containing protein n=1 Tax=Methanolobus sp. WCC4 TaxID=3125784 RepID=UPI0030F50E71
MTNYRTFLFIFILIMLILPVSASVNVTFSPDEGVITSRLDRGPEFTVNVSNTSDIFWYLDDELISTYNDVNYSSYTPDISETGNYSIKVNVSSVNGAASGQWYWLATATPSQIMSDGSSGGSGGSSGSVSTGEDYGNIALKDVQMKIVNKGKTISYTFPESSNPIDSVEFVSSVNSGYVKTTIEVLKGRSSSVSKNPDDAVYSYSNIVLSNLALENRLTDIRIVFHVDTEWIDENGIEVDSVRLNVFDGSGWKTFPVRVIDENGHNFTFVSTTTEFGSFAITGKASEDQDGDVVVIDMGGDATDPSSSDDDGFGGNADTSKNEEEDVLASVLRSMTELFIKRNPVSS